MAMPTLCGRHRSATSSLPVVSALWSRVHGGGPLVRLGMFRVLGAVLLSCDCEHNSTPSWRSYAGRQVHVACAAYLGPTFFVSEGRDAGLVDGVDQMEPLRYQLVSSILCIW